MVARLEEVFEEGFLLAVSLIKVIMTLTCEQLR